MYISAPARPQPALIFAALDREWARLARRPEMASALQRWAQRCPCLAGARSAQELVARAHWHGYAATPESRPVLRALLVLAGDELAGRALLQALLPRLRAERVDSPRFGHRLGEHAQSAADTAADLVAECYGALRRHAGEDHADVARLVVQEATRKLRTARQAQRRYQERHCVPSGLEAMAPASLSSSARTDAEWLALAVCRAVRSGALPLDQARLLYAARVKGEPACEVGRQHGLRPKAVYYALARAEQAFLVGAA